MLLGRSIVLVSDRGLPGEGDNKRIDILWRGKKSGSLTVLLGHLLALNWKWTNAEIRLIRLIQKRPVESPRHRP